MARKYAISMTSVGMTTGVNAIYNGLKHFGNDIDFHLIGDDKEYAELNKDIIFHDIDEYKKKFNVPDDKGGGWYVRFLRYKLAEEMADQYDAIMIVDADMLCLNNIMKFFKIAAETGMIVIPSNPWGATVEKVLQSGTEMLKGASSPPYHSLTILDPKKHIKLLQEVWDYGIKEPYGDMVTLSRSLFRLDLIDQIYALPNHQWILSTFYLDYLKPKGDKLTICEEEVYMIHRRWWMTDVCEKYYNDIKYDTPEKLIQKRIGRNNVKIFFDTFKKFNTQIGIKIDFPYDDPKLPEVSNE